MADKAQGYAGWLAFKAESTYGEAVGVPTIYWRTFEESLKYDPTLQHHSQLKNLDRIDSHILEGNASVSGSIKMAMMFESLTSLLIRAGFTDSVSGAGTAKTHSMKLNDTISSMQFLVNQGNAAYFSEGGRLAYNGMVIQKLTLSQAVDDFLQMNLDLVGKQSSVDTQALTPTYIASPKWVDYSMLTAVTIGGTTIGNVISAEIVLDNKFEPLFRMGDNNPTEVVRTGQREVSLKLEVDLTDVSVLKYQALLAARTGVDIVLCCIVIQCQWNQAIVFHVRGVTAEETVVERDCDTVAIRSIKYRTRPSQHNIDPGTSGK